MGTNSFDVVIVGAGSAGCVTAFNLCKKGFQVALIERKTKNTIGKKVCGDAISELSFDVSGIPKPIGEEKKQTIKGLDLYNPNMKTKIRVETDTFQGYILDRYLFGQRLLKLALDIGAQLFTRHHATGFLHDTNRITGVSTKALDSQKRELFKAPLTVDASGSSAVLRKKLPPELTGFIEPKIREEDNFFAYREIRNVQQPLDDPKYLKIYLDHKSAPKGYIWIFPRGEGIEDSVNVGLGGASTGQFNFRAEYKKYVQKHPLFINSQIIDQGSGKVPRRRAIDCLVTDGFVLAGDAGCQVNPLHAGGLGPSLEVGRMVTKTFEKALEAGDFTSKSLWFYNVQYQRTVGVRYSSYDIMKTALNEATNEELDFIFDKQIISQEDLSKLGIEGTEVTMSTGEKILRGFRGVKKLPILFRLNKLSKLMKEIRTHYMSYPEEIDQFLDWQTKLKRQFYPKK
ncbi:MAG: geranylgeranyl reductase family protein [Candidatus Hodarchaeota archaeon]